LTGRGIQNKTIYGATPIESGEEASLNETRESKVREFHKPDSFSVLIANPFAVSESISLHKAAHNAIYLDRTFNCAHYMQSKDRIHRYGLLPTDRISYYFLLSDNSIDEVIHRRLLQKEARMLEIIEKEPIPLIDMNRDTWDDESNDVAAVIKDYQRRVIRNP